MTRRILVVDDNAANLALVLYLFKAFGYEADGFQNAHAALQALDQHSYDAAVVDMLVPEIDGFEFARRVRAQHRLQRLPLIAVTALAMVGDRERILAAGFDGYIAKPIDPERFVQQVEQFFAPAPLILVVDDVTVNRQVIRGALAPFGYRIAEASGARDAIAHLEKEKPSLILCDVHMPAGGGFELVEHVKGNAALRDIPFIFISSTAWQTHDKRRGLELGAQKFILRPIDPQQLLDEVRAALGEVHGKSTRR